MGTVLALLVLPLAWPWALWAAEKRPDVPAPGHFWQTLPAPKVGEWLDVFPEDGQTFREYREVGPTRPDRVRKKIYVLPLLTQPPSDKKLLSKLAQVMRAFYGLDVKVLKPQAMPKRAYRPGGRRFDILQLVPALRTALPQDGVFVLGVTDRDLHLTKHGPTFGWAHFRLRVGVMSTSRLGSAKDPRYLRRVLTLALHESGHMLSMAHCIFYKCLMNGVRTLGESDRRPAVLCPVCRAKLCWNTGLDPIRHYGGLSAAYQRAGDKAAARQAAKAKDVTRLAISD